jgi:peptidoglycan hydrolase CwlO-like protein
MHRLRAVWLALAFLLLASALFASNDADAQTKEQVDSALGRVERARRELAAAQGRVAAALGQVDEAQEDRSFVSDELTSAIDRYAEINDELENVSFELARLGNRVLEYEAEVRDLREDVRSRAVQAYMAGGTEDLDTLFAADSLYEVTASQEVLRQASNKDVVAIDRFAVTRRTMEEVKERYEFEQERVAALRDEANLAVLQLDQLFEDADDVLREAETVAAEAGAEVSEAESAVQAAVGNYEAAVRAFEEEVRKQAQVLGVQGWRALVVKYFPAGRVTEALKVMRCESSGRANAYNASSGTAGLFQFKPRTWAWASANAGFGGASPFNAEANIASAAWLMNNSIRAGLSAWSQWSCKP